MLEKHSKKALGPFKAKGTQNMQGKKERIREQGPKESCKSVDLKTILNGMMANQQRAKSKDAKGKAYAKKLNLTCSGLNHWGLCATYSTLDVMSHSPTLFLSAKKLCVI